MKYQYVKGSTSVIIPVFIQANNQTDGRGLAGLDESSSIVGGYVRPGEVGLALAVDQNVTTEGTYEAPTTDNQIRIGTPANMTAGTYELHLHNDLLAAGADSVFITLGGAANMAVLVIEIQLTDFDLNQQGLSATATSNLELQYDTTGLSGDTFPSTQAQVSQIGSGGGAANNEFVIAAPNGFVITTGSGEVNDEDATVAGGGTVHQISDTAGTMDVYYLFDIGGSFTPRNIVHEGRSNSINQDLGVYVNTNTQASPTWVQRATLLGSALSTNIRRIWPLAAGDLMVGADAGKVAVRFQATGLSSATLTTDQILVEKGSISSLVGYANGQVWVDTVSGTAGTVIDVNGVADKAVDLWTSAITISVNKGLAPDFHIINGSTIALTASSDNYSLFGDNWTLQLESRSVAGAYFQGAIVTGIGTSSSEVHFEGCEVGTMSVQIGHFDFCSFGGTVTMTLAGDYNYHNCYSMIPGPLGPDFTKTAGQAITAQWRGWAGSINLTGLETGDTLTIGGAELGTIDLGSPAGAPVVEIRGIYKELVNAGSASVNLDGAILAADVALILGDTNELQGVLSAGILARSNNPNLNALLGVDDAASKTIGHTIWDKVLSKANHDIAQSAAKLLRQLASFVIANNDARVVGSPGINQIQLAASESSVDGTFDPGIIGIIDGTGAGQCRMILEYDGTSKIATLNRDWKVAPDVTSEYVILCSEGGLHVNEGLAQGGGASSITLNSLASTDNNVYNGQFVFLVSGTGQDQVGRVTAYNGTSKVATIETTMNGWAVQPDTTTGYIMIPILDITPTLLGTPVALDGAAATIAAMLTKLADDNGGADFDAETDSQRSSRARGDAAWITATGFNTVVPDAAGTAASLHTTTDGLVTTVDTVVDAIKVITDALTAAAAAKLALSTGTIVSGAAEAGTLSTTQMTTDLTEATADHYNGRVIIWTSGVLQNQATDITDYVGAAGLLTFTAVTEAPSAADTFIIV